MSNPSERGCSDLSGADSGRSSDCSDPLVDLRTHLGGVERVESLDERPFPRIGQDRIAVGGAIGETGRVSRVWTWHETDLDPGPGAPLHARVWLGVVFGLRGPGAVDVEVITSELVLWAIEARDFDEDDCITVSADRPPGAIHVEVAVPHAKDDLPAFSSFASDVLESRTAGWGSTVEDGNVTAWFEVALPAARWELEVADDQDLIEQMAVDSRAGVELTERYDPLIGRFIARYRRSGLEADDLYQVGREALLGAASRFDSSLGSFERYVSRTISGALKKHLRDRGWSVRPPRGLQELVLELRTVEQQLEQQLGRVPSTAEVAAESGRLPDEIERARQAAGVFDSESLDAPLDPDGTGDRRDLGSVDSAIARAPGWAVVDSAMAALGDREREIVRLRYFEDLSQRQIADRVGLSQMHISRLLHASIDEMKRGVGVSDSG
ncbi:MAG: sigma-70 family RNA polymerase sigma factor [Acidimicrobiia bacterium]